MKFLIFGSTGLLGSNLLKVINEKNYSVGVISLNSVIGYDLSLLEREIVRFEPEIVVNAAAITNIGVCHDNPMEAQRVNSVIPRDLVKILSKYQVPFVQISTEAVFLGETKGKIYSENDQANPKTEYGRTKLKGEQVTLDSQIGLVIRLPRLFARRAQIVATLFDRIHNGISVSEENYSTPVIASLAAETIIEICLSFLSNKFPRNLLHVTGSDIFSMYELIWNLSDNSQRKKIRPVKEDFFPKVKGRGAFLNGGLSSNAGFVIPFAHSLNRFHEE